MARETHDVTNQSPPFEDVNLFASDVGLQDAVVREGGAAAVKSLDAFGIVTGSRRAFERGRLANEFPPRLKTHDRQGRRLDVVEFHPAYHALMATSFSEALHCSPWFHLGQTGAARRPGAHVERAGAFYMAVQMEAGLLPHYDDQCGGADAAPAAGSRQSVAAAHSGANLRSRICARRKEGLRHIRHGHDGEAGWDGRPRQHNAWRAGGSRWTRRRIHSHRPQMVPFGADVGCVSSARAST